MSLKIQFVPIIYNELGYNRIRAMSCYITQSALVFLILSEQYSSLHDKGEIYGIREAFKIRVPFGYFLSKSLNLPPPSLWFCRLPLVEWWWEWEWYQQRWLLHVLLRKARKYFSISLFQYLIFWYLNISIFQYSNIPIFEYLNIWIFQYLNIKIFKIPIFQYWTLIIS